MNWKRLLGPVLGVLVLAGVGGAIWFSAQEKSTGDKAAAQALIAQLLPVATAANPKYRSGDSAELWLWLTRAVRFGPDASPHGIVVEMDEEALVFKVYDSEKDGRARWTAHTAFDDETAPPNARPRESIEIRTLAFF